jgi:hypothetical protein
MKKLPVATFIIMLASVACESGSMSVDALDVAESEALNLEPGLLGRFDSLEDHSVNNTSYDVTLDRGRRVLELNVVGGSNPAGGFNGSGDGNKVILGLKGYDGTPLADLNRITLDYRTVSGDQSPYVNLNIDLDCDGFSLEQGDRIAALMAPAFSTHWRTLSAGPNTSIGLYPGNTSSTLATLLKDAPNACLADAATGDRGMPAGDEVTEAIVFVAGDSITTTAQTIRIDELWVDVRGNRRFLTF